jgi:hypothetical protein
VSRALGVKIQRRDIESFGKTQMKVFWSWQSDTPGKIGRHFIRERLNEAIAELKEASEIEEREERELLAEMHLDHDRQGISGSPGLAELIQDKIRQATVFVADVTPVGEAIAFGDEDQRKKLINSNVAIELGYSLGALGDRKLLMV